MNPRSPLRKRLVAGSLLWTIGLVVVTNVVTLGLILHRYPGWTVHFSAMTLVATGLLAAGLLQLRSILAPFRQLQSRLGAVREGREPRLEGAYPAELQPLVTDLNALLDHRAQLVTRAIARSGDLAHGLKTPLAVLGQEAERLTDAGQFEAAAIIGQQVERMRRQIDWHLAHARAAASGATPGTATALQPSIDGLVRTLARLHADKGLRMTADVAPDLTVRVQREDLEEMLGNLLDNACKWGRAHVTVTATRDGESITITVEDDGPGLAEDLRERVLQRGVRADEQSPGTGFGLAIVRDLAELHGGSIRLEGATAGGLRAVLRLPAAG